jgi:K+-sensing histidine kinase KdpD
MIAADNHQGSRALWRAASPVLLSVLGVALFTAPLLAFSRNVATSLVPIAYLIPVMFVATRWGIWPAMVASIAAMAAADFFFFAPLYSFRVDDPQEAVDLLLFLIVSMVSSNLASGCARRPSGSAGAKRTCRRCTISREGSPPALPSPT